MFGGNNPATTTTVDKKPMTEQEEKNAMQDVTISCDTDRIRMIIDGMEGSDAASPISRAENPSPNQREASDLESPSMADVNVNTPSSSEGQSSEAPPKAKECVSVSSAEFTAKPVQGKWYHQMFKCCLPIKALDKTDPETPASSFQQH